MLKTLGYRIPANRLTEILGEVHAHPWDQDFADAWDALPRRGPVDSGVLKPAYRQLRAGLVAAHGRPVHIVDYLGPNDQDRAAGHRGMILSAGTIEPFRLSACLRTFERLLRGGQDINSLAPLLGGSAPVERSFAEYVGREESGTVTAPGWVFDTAAWAVAARLTGMLNLEDHGPSISLRMDTDGCLLGWDDLVWNQWGEGIGYGMLRIRPKIVTLPTCSDLIITFDSHLSRIGTQWRGNKSAWIDRKETASPVLRVPIRNVRHEDGDDVTWTQEVANFAASIAESCGVEALDLDPNLPAVPGRVRPLIRGPVMHPIGKGPGPRLMLRVAEHIEARCPDLEPLVWTRDTTMRVPRPRRQKLGPVAPQKPAAKKTASKATPGGKPAKATKPQPPPYPVLPETIVNAVRAAGGTSVRLLCLYATSEARARMSSQLEQLTSGATPAVDGDVRALCEGFDVSFHRMVDLLRHGDHDRTTFLADIDAVARDSQATLFALVETEYDAKTGRPKDDAKDPVKRLLVARGINPQFLATAPPPPTPTDDKPKKAKPAKKKAPAKPGVDYAAGAATADLLLRSAGVFHPSHAQSALGPFLDGSPATKVHLVGIHMRSQNSRQPNTPPRMVVTVVDVEASNRPGQAWPVRMWSDSLNSWTGYPKALAAYHSGRIGSQERGRGKKAVPTRHYVESILDALPNGPVVIFVDAPSTRGIWPGLQNHSFAQQLLPGTNLTAVRDVAVVRCNNSDEIPRPIHRSGGAQPKDTRKPATPEQLVYREEISGVWMFGKSSKSYRAKGGRTGAEYTPWTLPEDLRFLLQDDWHSYTGTEIAVARPGSWDERQLVTLTARLCDHTVVWDDRTLTPLPLHLASRPDLTHPDYRAAEED